MRLPPNVILGRRSAPPNRALIVFDPQLTPTRGRLQLEENCHLVLYLERLPHVATYGSVAMWARKSRHSIHVSTQSAMGSDTITSCWHAKSRTLQPTSSTSKARLTV